VLHPEFQKPDKRVETEMVPVYGQIVLDIAKNYNK